MEEFHSKVRIVSSCLAHGYVGDISMSTKLGNCELKCYLSPHRGWCCVNDTGIKTNFPQYVIASCDLLMRFCIYKPAMKEVRFHNNHNHNNKQAKRAEQAEAPPSWFSCQQATPGGGWLRGMTWEGSGFAFVCFEFGVRDACSRETKELGDGM